MADGREFVIWIRLYSVLVVTHTILLRNATQRTILVFRPRLDLKILDPPHKDAFFFSDPVPGFLALGGRLLDLVIQFGAD